MVATESGRETMTIGDFVRRQRGRMGLSQKQLAAMLSKDDSWVSRLETGRAKEIPSPDELRELARALHCSEADLLRAAGYLESDDVAQDEEPPVLTMAEDDLRWNELPPRVRRMIRGMVDEFFADDEEDPRP